MPILFPHILEDSPCYYEVLRQKTAINILVQTVSQCDHKETLLVNNLLLGTAQPEDVAESNLKNIF